MRRGRGKELLYLVITSLILYFGLREGRERGGGNFKSALSPLFMVGLGWGKGQI